MCVGHIHPHLSSTVAEDRRRDLMRSVERDRLLREAGIPTAVETVRLTVGRGIVRIGTLVAGRRGWTPAAEPLAGSPATHSALTLAR